MLCTLARYSRHRDSLVAGVNMWARRHCLGQNHCCLGWKRPRLCNKRGLSLYVHVDYMRACTYGYTHKASRRQQLRCICPTWPPSRPIDRNAYANNTSMTAPGACKWFECAKAYANNTSMTAPGTSPTLLRVLPPCCAAAHPYKHSDFNHSIPSSYFVTCESM